MKNDPSDKKIHNAAEIPPATLAKFSLFARAQVIAMMGALVGSGTTVGSMLNRSFELLNLCQDEVSRFCDDHNLCCGCCGAILYANINHSFWRTLSANLNKMAGLEKLTNLVQVPITSEELAEMTKPHAPKPEKRGDGSPGISPPQTPGVN